MALWGMGTWLAVVGSGWGANQTVQLDEPVVGGRLPYSIGLREVSFAPAAIPAMHSAAAAEWEGRWVLLAGRTNGLHGMTGRDAFDPAFENREVWVIDPASRRSWRKSLETSPASGLSADQVDALSSVNTQFYQDGANWIIVGGYGFKRSVADHVTYDTLTAIDLPGLVSWVTAVPGREGSRAVDHIRQIRDPYFQVTGGGLERIGDEYQLVFGQNYAGRYRPHFNGVYTRQVRRFRLRTEGGLAVVAGSKLGTPVSEDFRRRDLNITTIVSRGSQPGEFREAVVALSGVFTPTDGVWTLPVTIEAGGAVTMEDPADPASLKQGFQVYHCAKAGMYHRATDEMHVVLFGGITVLEYNGTSGTWSEDALAPFTNQCGAVVRDAAGRYSQYFLPTRFPRILEGGKELRFGANAEFFPSAGVPRLHQKVIDLAAIREPTVIGHLYGGLAADAGNGGNTGSSGRIFEVVLTPHVEPVVPQVQREDDRTLLSWQSQAEAGYVIEHSEGLLRWEEAAAPIAGNGSLLEWFEVRDEPRHFYRILEGVRSQGP